MGPPPPELDILTKRRWTKDKRSKHLSERPKSRKVRTYMLKLSGLCALYFAQKGAYKVFRLDRFAICGLCVLCGVEKVPRTPVFVYLLQYN